MSWDEQVEELEEHAKGIALTVMEYNEVYERVRPHADSDVIAAMVTHRLVDVMGKQYQREQDDPSDNKATEVQLLALEKLGIESLRDLTKEQAKALVDMANKQPDAESKEWY